MANKPKAKPDLLPFPVIAAATNGNVDAINTVQRTLVRYYHEFYIIQTRRLSGYVS